MNVSSLREALIEGMEVILCREEDTIIWMLEAPPSSG